MLINSIINMNFIEMERLINMHKIFIYLKQIILKVQYHRCRSLPLIILSILYLQILRISKLINEIINCFLTWSNKMVQDIKKYYQKNKKSKTLLYGFKINIKIYKRVALQTWRNFKISKHWLLQDLHRWLVKLLKYQKIEVKS